MFFKSKILFSTVLSLSFFSYVSASNLSREMALMDIAMEDLDIFQKLQTTAPVPTRNQKGVQFPTLGSYEKKVMRAVTALKTAEIQDPTVLVLGDGYGRFSQEILKRTNSNTNVIVNDLSGDNLRPFMGHLRDARDAIKKRTFVDFGDGLNILNRRHSSKLFDEATQAGKVDLFVCNNMWHFLDGREILDLYVLMGKILKPGGKAFLFGHSRKPNLSPEDIITYQEIGQLPQAIALRSSCTLMSLLTDHQDKSVLFPGLMRHSLITKANPLLSSFFAQCPNGDVLSNTIPFETHQKLANALDFNLESLGYYLTTTDKSSGKGYCSLDDNGTELGICLTRTEDTVSSRDGISQEFQDRCDNAFSQNETFITTHTKPADAPDFLKFES